MHKAPFNSGLQKRKLHDIQKKKIKGENVKVETRHNTIDVTLMDSTIQAVMDQFTTLFRENCISRF